MCCVIKKKKTETEAIFKYKCSTIKTKRLKESCFVAPEFSKVVLVNTVIISKCFHIPACCVPT